MATARSIGGKLKFVTCGITGNAECPYINNYKPSKSLDNEQRIFIKNGVKFSGACESNQQKMA